MPYDLALAAVSQPCLLSLRSDPLLETCPVDTPPSLWYCRAMLGETKSLFSLTRAALSTGGRTKSKFLSVKA